MFLRKSHMIRVVERKEFSPRKEIMKQKKDHPPKYFINKIDLSPSC